MVTVADLPEDTLLQRYIEPPCYTDCFATTLSGDISLPRYVEAFYTAPLFCVERLILGTFAGHPSTDLEAKAVAQGTAAKFAAWDVEDRTTNQLLMCDMKAATRSWFMTRPTDNATTLYFGSAVTPRDGKEMGAVFRAFLPAHTLYSKRLLSGARKRLLSQDQY